MLILNVDLSSLVRSKIENEGPITLKSFFNYVLKIQNECISPQYLKKNFKDFSINNSYNIFEEMITKWCVSFWKTNNKPTNLKIIVFSPKTGVLISKIFEHSKNKIFKKNIELYIVEPNPYFANLQKQNLKHYSKQIKWVSSFEEISIDSFSITIANKFFSSLPIDQYTRKQDEWFLNMVSLNRNSQYFCITHLDTLNKNMSYFLNANYPNVQEGGIVELHDNTTILLKKIVNNVKKFGGGILVTDYGYTNQTQRPYISTLQSKSHKRWYSPFYNLGRNTLTSQLNFSNLKENIELQGGKIYGPISQKDFLFNMKIEKKKINLLAQLPQNEHPNIIAEYKMLTSKKQISYLLKAMLICNRSNTPIGFTL